MEFYSSLMSQFELLLFRIFLLYFLIATKKFALGLGDACQVWDLVCPWHVLQLIRHVALSVQKYLSILYPNLKSSSSSSSRQHILLPDNPRTLATLLFNKRYFVFSRVQCPATAAVLVSNAATCPATAINITDWVHEFERFEWDHTQYECIERHIRSPASQHPSWIWFSLRPTGIWSRRLRPILCAILQSVGSARLDSGWWQFPILSWVSGLLIACRSFFDVVLIWIFERVGDP